MSDPQRIGDILKSLLVIPPSAKVGMHPAVSEYSPVCLELLKPENGGLFYDLVNDHEVKKFFPEFNDVKDAILVKLEEINGFPEIQEFWAIMEGDDMAGYIALKRSIHLLDLLFSVPESDVDDPGFFDFLELTMEEQQAAKLKEREEKLLIAPYGVEVVVHRDFRRKKIATRAFEQTVLKSENRGIREIYFEIHQDNGQANNWAASLGAKLVTSTVVTGYPAHIYRYDLQNQAIQH